VSENHRLTGGLKERSLPVRSSTGFGLKLVWMTLLSLCAGVCMAQALTISSPEVLMKDDTSAWVIFTTSVPAKATIAYQSVNGTTTGATRTVSETDFDTAHAVLLTDLIPGLMYQGTITATAEDNSTTNADIAPFLAMGLEADVEFETSPQVFIIDSGEAVVAFTTNNDSIATVNYGRNGATGLTAQETAPVKDHVLFLQGLISGETYTYLVSVTGEDGSVAGSAPMTFTVAPVESDLTLTPPEVFVTGQNSAWVIFTTNQPAQASVEFHGPVGAIRTVTETDFETEHALLLTGLINGQTYQGQVTVTGQDGSIAAAFIQPFVQTEIGQDIGFEIQPVVLSISPTEAVVAFTTTVPSIGRVDVGIGGIFTQNAKETEAVTDHALFLTGLKPGQTYDFQVSAQAEDGSFVTTTVGQFTQSAIEPEFRPGDLNNDGSVNVVDAIMGLQAIVGIIDLTPQQAAALDVNQDGKLSVKDVTRILQIAVGLFPQPGPLVS
jgi:lipid-binding SYLF domain-containing protein